MYRQSNTECSTHAWGYREWLAVLVGLSTESGRYTCTYSIVAVLVDMDMGPHMYRMWCTCTVLGPATQTGDTEKMDESGKYSLKLETTRKLKALNYMQSQDIGL